jgi:hypothetical protein
MKISEHISLEEATSSPYATAHNINNVPGPVELSAMKLVAEKVFEPLRIHFNVPLKINSFYRCPQLNKAIGGASTSQHVKGEAIDVDATGAVTNKDLFLYIKDHLPYDQAIWEGGTDENPNWVHVSYNPSGIQRKQLLRMTKVNGKSVYTAIT